MQSSTPMVSFLILSSIAALEEKWDPLYLDMVTGLHDRSGYAPGWAAAHPGVAALSPVTPLV